MRSGTSRSSLRSSMIFQRNTNPAEVINMELKTPLSPKRRRTLRGNSIALLSLGVLYLMQLVTILVLRFEQIDTLTLIGVAVINLCLLYMVTIVTRKA